MPSLGRGLLATGGYIALTAAASFYVFQIAEPPANLPHRLAALLPFQLVAVALCLWILIRGAGWRAVGFGRLNWGGLVWLLPATLVLAVMAWQIADTLVWEDIVLLGTRGIILLTLTPFLIAFGEEVMFRGILLRGAMATLPVMQAMMLSAVIFGAFHLVNGIAGQGMSETSQQVIFALLVGFFLAPIAVRIGNLWPLIIWHWLWNVVVYLSQLAEVMHSFVLIGIAAQAVISIWLWADVISQSQTD